METRVVFFLHFDSSPHALPGRLLILILIQ